jgi:hypothetical protein
VALTVKLAAWPAVTLTEDGWVAMLGTATVSLVLVVVPVLVLLSELELPPQPAVIANPSHSRTARRRLIMIYPQKMQSESTGAILGRRYMRQTIASCKFA